jgi:hypothetical protein
MTDKVPHIEYRIVAEKPYEIDHKPGVDCYDRFEGTIHGKADADGLVAALKGLGYNVKLIRVSHTYLIDEKFGHESPDEADPGETPA